MSKRKMPGLPETGAPDNVTQVVAPKALERWSASVAPARALAEGEGGRNVIEMLDVIGEDFWTGGGVTAKRVQAQLKTMKGDITVLMNSPGGVLTEGQAIYNLLRAHDGEVTVKVLAMAASIASVIAMAGDRIEIAKSGFMMLHNCSTIAIGTRHEMRAAMEWAEMCDETMREIYADRSGLSLGELTAMMDRETFLRGQAAIDKKLADAMLPADEVTSSSQARVAQPAAHRIDVALARAGLARGDRRRLLADLKSGTQNAAAVVTLNADDDPVMEEALATLRSIKIT